MHRLWLWTRDTRRHSTWPCLRGSSDKLSVSVQMDCDLRDGLEILSEEPPTARGPGSGLQWPPCPACSFLLQRRSRVEDKLSIPLLPQLRYQCGIPERERPTMDQLEQVRGLHCTPCSYLKSRTHLSTYYKDRTRS